MRRTRRAAAARAMAEEKADERSLHMVFDLAAQTAAVVFLIHAASTERSGARKGIFCKEFADAAHFWIMGYMKKTSITILVAVSLLATCLLWGEKTASGIDITMLKKGTGRQPTADNIVKVHYRGTLTNGSEFDSSYKRGQPASFPLRQVIPCWTEGVQKIKVGGKAKLVCPANLAYGSQGRPGIPANSTLIFEVELLDIVR